MKIKVYDAAGKSKEDLNLKVEEAINDVDSNVLAQYVRVFQVNQRQGTSKTKDKSEVSGGGKKPWRQKGTGRARVGSIRSPLWTGGGVVHGPSPKSWSIKALKNLKKQALQMAFAKKAENDAAKVFEISESFEYSTKNAGKLIDSLKVEGKVLVIHQNSDKVHKSFRNMPFVRVTDVSEVSAYEVLASDSILIESNAFEVFKNKFFNGD